MNVANTESIILEILWAESPLNIGQIIARAKSITDWHENTIKTLVTRLYKKQLVSRIKDGKQYFYSPVVERSQVVHHESENLLGKFFEGKLPALVAHFAQSKKLNEQDIKEIEAILANMKTDD